MKKWFSLVIFINTVLSLVLVAPAFAGVPKNIIFMIGDGKGFEQDKAASIYLYGNPGMLVYEDLYYFPYYGEVTTYSASSSVTDSAAAATAMATGVKVNNGVVSMSGSTELETLLEYFRDQRKSTGLVTTVYISHATPAGFGAHDPDRNNYTGIANDYLTQTRPNILFGGTASATTGINYYSDSQLSTTYGYSVVSDYIGLTGASGNYISGQFSIGALPYEYGGNFDTIPHLSEMAYYALRILDDDPDGFFIMIEGGLIDWASHSNLIEETIHETVEFENAVQVVLDWIALQANPEETLLIVTADHETGGLSVSDSWQGPYPRNFLEEISWSTTGHTAKNVPVYARGENANFFFGVIDNTDYFELITCADKPVNIQARSLQYDSIQTGYDNAQSGETIKTMTAIIEEPSGVYFDASKTVTIQGGYRCGYADDPNYTIIRGNVSITDGTVTLANVIIE